MIKINIFVAFCLHRKSICKNVHKAQSCTLPSLWKLAHTFCHFTMASTAVFYTQCVFNEVLLIYLEIFKIIFNCVLVCACLHVGMCVCAYRCSWRPKELGHRELELDSCKLPDGCWELYLGPLQE